MTMRTDDMLRQEIGRLYALEGGLVAVFDQLEGKPISRRAATSIITLIEAADRHLTDLERISAEAGWPLEPSAPLVVEAWRTEVEDTVLGAPRCAAADALCVALLRRAVHLKIPCYESASLCALYAERPLIARSMRLALEDEFQSLERLRGAAELGISLNAAGGL